MITYSYREIQKVLQSYGKANDEYKKLKKAVAGEILRPMTNDNSVWTELDLCAWLNCPSSLICSVLDSLVAKGKLVRETHAITHRYIAVDSQNRPFAGIDPIFKTHKEVYYRVAD